MSEEEHQSTQQDVKSEDNAPINVKVVSSGGEEVFFKIKRNTKLSKLQGAYANKVGKDVGSIRFLYDGSRINDDDTPASLDMDDNDTIDVMARARAISIRGPQTRAGDGLHRVGLMSVSTSAFGISHVGYVKALSSVLDVQMRSPSASLLGAFSAKFKAKDGQSDPAPKYGHIRRIIQRKATAVTRAA
ncbi:hypothetical protein EVG20_g4980 [Dentipellis fragilis]|uniref:Ubiquitin-like domain-containing protein n=1 Tax=Dentipellis fragilis TaxID=205917 RepID=A0A4Y9YUR0_9AGAM|nr:hypothetical protein EVG20_g4980 [Dentipellis fragilis]